MARVRGRVNGLYITDGSTSYSTSVDADRFALTTFGWTAASALDNPLPRNFTPRHVTGLSATSGRRGIATVPSVAADVWTGVATTFDVEADDQTIDTMTIKRRINEKPALA